MTLHLRPSQIASAVVLLALVSSSARAQADSRAPSSRAADSARIAAQMRVARWYLPGDEHRILSRLAGEWSATITFPGQSASQSRSLTGIMRADTVLGRRFLEIKTSAAAGEASVDALTILGFDGRHDRFTYVGFDTFGTYYVTAEGQLNAARDELVLEGTDRESPTRSKHFEVVFRFSSEDEFTQDIVFHREDGGSFVVLSGRYVRRRVAVFR
jgi:hypothetical protein